MKILKYFNPALFIILIVCFFLPFVQVSCGGEKLIEASGIDIVTGSDNSKETKSEDKTRDDNYRYIMIIAFGITLIGFIISILPLIKGMEKSSKIFYILMAGITLSSFILLILYIFLTDRSLKDTKNILEFKLLYGFYVVEILYIITTINNILLIIFPDRKIEPQQQVAYSSMPPLSQNKICRACGAENITGASFCKNCGNKL